jgi:hypothetical protein
VGGGAARSGDDRAVSGGRGSGLQDQRTSRLPVAVALGGGDKGWNVLMPDVRTTVAAGSGKKGKGGGWAQYPVTHPARRSPAQAARSAAAHRPRAFRGCPACRLGTHQSAGGVWPNMTAPLSSQYKSNPLLTHHTPPPAPPTPKKTPKPTRSMPLSPMDPGDPGSRPMLNPSGVPPVTPIPIRVVCSVTLRNFTSKWTATRCPTLHSAPEPSCSSVYLRPWGPSLKSESGILLMGGRVYKAGGCDEGG